MRNFTDSAGFTLNSAGGWIRGHFQRLRRNSNSQVDIKPSSSNDGQLSPEEEEDPTPEEIVTWEELLEGRRLWEAGLQLIDTESRLFGETPEEEEALHGHSEEVARLTAQRAALEQVLVQTLNQSLDPDGPKTTLASAVRTIYQEEQQDLKRASFRTPSRWKELHDATLRRLVEQRMDNPSPSPSGPWGRSSIQTDIHNMGRQLKQDLLLVVQEVKSCYPPESNICQFYASLFHQSLAARLRKVADFVLDHEDCSVLLRWVNEYYPGILNEPELEGEINAAALGDLLPDELLVPLEDQYVCSQESKLLTFITRVLEEEEHKWSEGKEPTKEDGRYVSPLAYDIIQLINGMVTAAERVTGSVQRAQSLTNGLPALLQRFKAFQENVIKQNRKQSPAQIKANLSCVSQFRDVLLSRGHLFPEDVQKNCLDLLTDLNQSAQRFLLTPVHKALKPQYQKLGTSEWLKKNSFQKLLNALEEELRSFQDLRASCQQELVGQLHQEVTQEYMRRLLRGEVKLKDREQQLKASNTISNNAHSLQQIFSSMGSKEDWLKEILIKIAEVLKLQEVPALQVQIALLGSAHPDLRINHVSSLLKMKSNISKPERRTIKQTLLDLQAEATPAADAQEFFSKL